MSARGEICPFQSNSRPSCVKNLAFRAPVVLTDRKVRGMCGGGYARARIRPKRNTGNSETSVSHHAARRQTGGLNKGGRW